jgi:hypothetical protein
MKITSYRNNSPQQGWCAIAMGIFFILLVQYFDPVGSNPDTGVFNLGSSGTKKLIEIIGSVFVMLGVWILIYSPKRIVSIDKRLRQIAVLDTSRFGQQHRNIPFDSITEVAIDQLKDTDPDSRFVHYEYWVSLYLLTGEPVEITDRSRHRDKITKIRADVIANMK